jgi:hypothetical protein
MRVAANIFLRPVARVELLLHTFFEFLLYDSEFDLPAVFDAFCLALRWLG